MHLFFPTDISTNNLLIIEKKSNDHDDNNKNRFMVNVLFLLTINIKMSYTILYSKLFYIFNKYLIQVSKIIVQSLTSADFFMSYYFNIIIIMFIAQIIYLGR